jgi:uncharacterized protein YjbJ (UPF0337 family)
LLSSNLERTGKKQMPVNHLKIRRKKMSLEERAKAAGKNIEGKAQEALGNLTGDAGDQVEGKAKQAEATARNAKEDVKDGVKDVVDKA